MNILYLLISLAESIWVLVKALSDENVADAIPPSFWVIIALIAISGILLILILILEAFHCYISCCLSITTLDFIIQNPSSSVSSRKY